MLVTMNREITPASVAPPAANYALAVQSDGAQRWLHVSGIVGVRPDGSIPADLSEQVAVVWSSLVAILAEAQMTTGDVVSITTYVVSQHLQSLPVVMAARDRALAGQRVASTLVTVPALARPEWKVEIALIAAQ
ncbi:MAG: RidA family protein [Actinobacteria bacterium]|nr:RidA family protein [Actinomycetota bacterium]